MKRIHIVLISLLVLFASLHIAEANHRYREVPGRVIASLDHRYHHFDLIHSKRYLHHGRIMFDLVIQHRNTYVMVSIGENGGFLRHTRHRYYPLDGHQCTSHCGFHYQRFNGGKSYYYGRGSHHYSNDRYSRSPYGACTVDNHYYGNHHRRERHGESAYDYGYINRREKNGHFDQHDHHHDEAYRNNRKGSRKYRKGG